MSVPAVERARDDSDKVQDLSHTRCNSPHIPEQCQDRRISWSYTPPPWYELPRRRLSLSNHQLLCPTTSFMHPSQEVLGQDLERLDLNVNLEGIKAAVNSISQYERDVYIQPISLCHDEDVDISSLRHRLDREITAEEVALSKQKWDAFVEELFAPCVKQAEETSAAASVAVTSMGSIPDDGECADGRGSPDFASLSYSSASSGLSLHRTESTHSSADSSAMDSIFDSGLSPSPTASDSVFVTNVTERHHHYPQPVPPVMTLPAHARYTAMSRKRNANRRTPSSSLSYSMLNAPVFFLPQHNGAASSPPPKRKPKHLKSKSSVGGSDAPTLSSPIDIKQSVKADFGNHASSPRNSSVSLKKDNEGFFYPSISTPPPLSSSAPGNIAKCSTPLKTPSSQVDPYQHSFGSPPFSSSPIDSNVVLPSTSDRARSFLTSPLLARKSRSEAGTPGLPHSEQERPGFSQSNSSDLLLPSSLFKESPRIPRMIATNGSDHSGAELDTHKLELDNDGWIRIQPSLKSPSPGKDAKKATAGKPLAMKKEAPKPISAVVDVKDDAKSGVEESVDDDGWIVWPTLNSPSPPSGSKQRTTKAAKIELTWPTLNSPPPSSNSSSPTATKQEKQSSITHKKSGTISYPSIPSSSMSQTMYGQQPHGRSASISFPHHPSSSASTSYSTLAPRVPHGTPMGAGAPSPLFPSMPGPPQQLVPYGMHPSPPSMAIPMPGSVGPPPIPLPPQTTMPQQLYYPSGFIPIVPVMQVPVPYPTPITYASSASAGWMGYA